MADPASLTVPENADPATIALYQAQRANERLSEHAEKTAADMARLEAQMSKGFTDAQDSRRQLFEKVDQLPAKIAQKFVTKDEFSPVKVVAYGLVAATCMGVLGIAGTAIVFVLQYMGVK